MEDVSMLAHRVLRLAADAGGELEAYVSHRVVTTAQAGSGGGLRHVGRAETLGVGVRAVLGDHAGYASTADISAQGLAAVVGRARANAQAGDADPAGARLPPPAVAQPVDGMCPTELAALPMPARLSLVTALARAVTSLDRRVRRIDTAEWRDEHRRVAIASTRGVDAMYETAFAELWCDALGEGDDATATDYAYWWGRHPGAVDVESLAREAIGRTVRLLGPLAPAHAVDLVVLDPAVAGLLQDAIGRALTGGPLGNRRSPFSGRMGEQVAAGFVRLDDDGVCVDAPRGAPVDDEGVPRRRTTLIDEGVLVAAMHSTATAASAGDQISTGNARRASHKAFPRAAPTALRLTATRSGLPSSVDAVYVQQVSGVAGISAITGRVSLGGVGFLIRDGEPAGRVPTLPIATTLSALLSELVSVEGDERAIPDLPVLAGTLVWRPPRPLEWQR